MRAGAVLRGGEVLSKCLSSGSRRSCVSIGMFFVCLMPVIRSYRYVLRSITPAVCRIAPNRTACDMLRSYSAVGRDRHSCVLGCRVVIRLCWFISGLRVFWRRSRRNTKETRGRGERSRRRGVGALLRKHISIAMLSAGSTLGLRAPDCAKETRLPGLSSFDSRQSAFYAARGDSGITKTCPALISGGRTAAGRASRATV